jgi:copper chaperone CopZ
MFNFIKKETKGELIKFKIEGMHCVSCALNIDATLEEMAGVIESDTSYKAATTKVRFEPQKITASNIKHAVENFGYKISKMNHQ